MFVIGITGGIGSGKSTVAAYLAQNGIKVIDADAVAKYLTSKDNDTMAEIRKVFGDTVVDENGALKREAMADLVFDNKRQLDNLNRILHTRVMDEIMRQVELFRQSKNVKVIALDVPLPVKRGFLDECDFVLAVVCDRHIRRQRLLARGLSASDAERRMQVQMTDEEYIALANDYLVNNGTPSELKNSIDLKIKPLLAERGIKFPIRQ